MALDGNLAIIFNDGCNARRDGISLLRNPHNPSDDINAHTYWRQGWKHYDQCWGIDVRGRWRVAPLRQVEA